MREGLKEVATLAPSHGYAELIGGVKGGWNGGINPFARMEVGHKFLPGLSGFVYTEVDPLGYQAGVGLKYQW